MKKIILFILMFILTIPILSQNLDEKKKQLEELSDKITKEQEYIKQVDEKKKKTEKDLSSTKKKKKQTDQKIKKLKKSEKTVKGKLDITIKSLRTTMDELNNLNSLCEKEFNELCFAHYRGILFPEKKIDSQLIASLILQTADEINVIQGKKSTLEKNKKKENNEYEDLIWTRIVTNKKSKKYSGQIGSLQKDISKYEKERKAAIERKKQLEAEADALDELITKLQAEILEDHFTYKFSTPKLIWPLKGEIIRDFGEHKSKEYKVSTINNGIDISVEEGTNVVAIEGGVVAFAEWYNGAGKLIIVDHQNGFYSLYSHNSNLLVSKGDKVSKNQVIAMSGKTGSTEQPCLHFELRKRGTPVNPLDYLE